MPTETLEDNRTQQTSLEDKDEAATGEGKTEDSYSVSFPPKSAGFSASKPLFIQKGHGTQLKDIPNVAFKLSTRKPDDNLQMLHSILFGKKAKAHNLKRNIGQFSGYAWAENEVKQKTKKRKKQTRKATLSKPSLEPSMQTSDKHKCQGTLQSSQCSVDGDEFSIHISTWEMFAKVGGGRKKGHLYGFRSEASVSTAELHSGTTPLQLPTCAIDQIKEDIKNKLKLEWETKFQTLQQNMRTIMQAMQQNLTLVGKVAPKVMQEPIGMQPMAMPPMLTTQQTMMQTSQHYFTQMSIQPLTCMQPSTGMLTSVMPLRSLPSMETPAKHEYQGIQQSSQRSIDGDGSSARISTRDISAKVGGGRKKRRIYGFGSRASISIAESHSGTTPSQLLMSVIDQIVEDIKNELSLEFKGRFQTLEQTMMQDMHQYFALMGKLSPKGMQPPIGMQHMVMPPMLTMQQTTTQTTQQCFTQMNMEPSTSMQPSTGMQTLAMPLMPMSCMDMNTSQTPAIPKDEKENECEKF